MADSEAEVSGAGGELQGLVLAAVGQVEGLSAFTLAPVQAPFPYAEVEAGLESDWSHKSGNGREVRLAVTLRDQGESPERVQRLAQEAEAAIGAAGNATAHWSIVSLSFVRSQVLRDARRGWAALIEYRARMLAA